METKGKGKVIIGIALAAIMIASVFAAMVPTGMSRPAADQIDCGDTIYIGEQGLDFDLDINGIYGDTGALEGVPETSTEDASPIAVSAGMTVSTTIEGKYYSDLDGVTGFAPWNDVNGNNIYDAGDTGDFYIYV